MRTDIGNGDDLPSPATAAAAREISPQAEWASSEQLAFKPDADGRYPPHRDVCFGCGPANDSGLQIELRAGTGGEIVCEYRFPERFQGGPGVAHGGAISAVLDDVLGTVPLVNGIPAVTARLTVNFRRPVVIGHEVSITARLAGVDGRKITATCEMRDSLGRVLADAEALLVAIEAGHFTRIAADLPPESIPDDFKPFLPGENYP
jgi:uncharacterized protein (TIGR00369 family)